MSKKKETNLDMEKAIPAEAYAKSNEIWEASSYFSALEYPDEPPGEDSIEENYYTSLISSQQMVSNDYTSLKFEPTPDNVDQSLELHNSLISMLSSSEPDELERAISEIEKDCIQMLAIQMKEKKIRNFGLDQTIEEIFIQNNYESMLEILIRHHVNHSAVASPFATSTSPSSSIASSSTLTSSSSSSSTPYFYATTQQQHHHHHHHLHHHHHHNNHLPNLLQPNHQQHQYRNEFPNPKKVAKQSDIGLLNHAFSLLKNSHVDENMFNTFRALIDSFINRFVKFLVTSSNDMIKQVGDVFVCLLKLDLPGTLRCYGKLSAHQRWNVVKNVLYYSFKLTLLNLSNMFNNEEGAASFCLILNSIYNYVKYLPTIMVVAS